MKAVVQDRYGDSNVLEIRDVDQPAPGVGELRIRVVCAAVNMADWHLMTGEPRIMRLGLGLMRPRTNVRGSDVAGVVEAIGPGVTVFRVGDEVLGTAQGAFAAYAIARMEDVTIKPSDVSFATAAASVMAGYTALRAVRDTARIERGDRVLITGAGGGVGSSAVQIAVHDGARVTGVCSTAKVPLVRSLGAERVIDYRTENLDGEYDAIIDTGGNRSIGVLRELLAPHGITVLVGGEGGNRIVGPMGRMLQASLASHTKGRRFVSLLATQRESDLKALAHLLDTGALRPPTTERFTLTEVPRAIDLLASGAIAGKAVIEVADPPV